MKGEINMATPSYMKGRKPIKIPLHSVMDVVRMINDLGHSDQFREAAEKKGAFVTVHRETVNFVKDYLVDNDLHVSKDVADEPLAAASRDDSSRAPRSLAKRIVGDGPDPYHCPF